MPIYLAFFVLYANIFRYDLAAFIDIFTAPGLWGKLLWGKENIFKLVNTEFKKGCN